MTKSSHEHEHAKGKSSKHPATEQSRRERESEQTYYVWDDPCTASEPEKWQKIFSQGRHLGGGFGLSGDTPLIAKWKWARTRAYGIRPFGIPVVHAFFLCRKLTTESYGVAKAGAAKEAGTSRTRSIPLDVFLSEVPGANLPVTLKRRRNRETYAAAAS